MSLLIYVICCSFCPNIVMLAVCQSANIFSLFHIRLKRRLLFYDSPSVSNDNVPARFRIIWQSRHSLTCNDYWRGGIEMAALTSFRAG
jgi:hypothetical protein